MNTPVVSVVIPAYNQAGFLGEAIQSVLDQTYTNLEVLVVNDASPDHTNDVVAQFDDPRVKLLIHEENKGLPAARNAGMRASAGELIALLDSDDIYHPNKLQTHIEFMLQHPEVGVSYNGRYELNYSDTTIRNIYRPPLHVDLADLVLGFPFTPSDMVIRREWAFRVNLFDERYVCGGEDIDLPCRLALAGCQFASVDRILNYRRHHSGRFRKNLACRLRDARLALEETFTDPRFPSNLKSLYKPAMKNHYLVLAYHAFAQNRQEEGQQFMREAINLVPSIAVGSRCELLRFLLDETVADDSMDHQQMWQQVFAQLPEELAWLGREADWAAGRGFLIKGVRALIWERPEAGRTYIDNAIALDAALEDDFIEAVTHQLHNYALEKGDAAANVVYDRLAPELMRVDEKKMRRITSTWAVIRAFDRYRAGDFARVRQEVMTAIYNTPSFLFNRGVVSIFLRSLWAVVT